MTCRVIASVKKRRRGPNPVSFKYLVSWHAVQFEAEFCCIGFDYRRVLLISAADAFDKDHEATEYTLGGQTGNLGTPFQ